jgi:hypothetical protein
VLAGGATLSLLLLLAAGCGRSEFEDRTARLTVGDVTSELDLDSCGLDGSTVFLVGRGPGAVVLQAVVGVEDDGSTGVTASTGITVEGGGWVREAPNSAVLAESLGASGVESWERRGQTGRAPGSISSAVVRGARIQVEGRLEPLDASSGLPIAGSPADARLVPFRLDARCDETTPTS